MVVDNALFLFVFYFFVQLVQYAIKTSKTDRIFHLKTTLVSNVAFNKVAHQQITVSLFSYL